VAEGEKIGLNTTAQLKVSDGLSPVGKNDSPLLTTFPVKIALKVVAA
jgi:hypothetical protein